MIIKGGGGTWSCEVKKIPYSAQIQSLTNVHFLFIHIKIVYNYIFHLLKQNKSSPCPCIQSLDSKIFITIQKYCTDAFLKIIKGSIQKAPLQKKKRRNIYIYIAPKSSIEISPRRWKVSKYLYPAGNIYILLLYLSVLKNSLWKIDPFSVCVLQHKSRLKRTRKGGE